MARAYVADDDIKHLWDFFFESQDPDLRSAISGLDIAVLGAGDEILRNYNRPGVPVPTYYETLIDLSKHGFLVGGLGDGFNGALNENFVDISFDTGGTNALKVVPFSTRADRVRDVTVIAVFYGATGVVFGGRLPFYFKLLANKGCEVAFEQLRNEYQGTATPIPICSSAVPATSAKRNPPR